MRNKFKVLGITTLVVLTVISGILVNAYLAKNYLFIYSTGTSDKAVLNTTWKMSQQEIERANKTTLSAPDIDLSGLGAPEVINQNRFRELVQKNVFLWGHISEIKYSFFDNKFYEYYISLTAYEQEHPYKEILETLRSQFGTGKEVEKKRADIIHSFEWDTEKQSISYWIMSNEDKKTYHVGMRAVYKPFYRQIEEIAHSEKKNVFNK